MGLRFHLRPTWTTQPDEAGGVNRSRVAAKTGVPYRTIFELILLMKC